MEFGSPVNDKLAQHLKDFFGNDISVIVADKDGSKYQAKTHSLTIPEKKYPFLKKVMQADSITIKWVTKNGKELTTNIVQAGEGVSEVSENVAQSSAVAQEISAELGRNAFSDKLHSIPAPAFTFHPAIEKD